MTIDIDLTFLRDETPTRLQLYRHTDTGILTLHPSGNHKDIPLQTSPETEISIDYSLFEEAQDLIDEKLVGLKSVLLQAESSGLELTLDDDSEESRGGFNYNIRDVYVENRYFSIKQLEFLMEEGDIELSPDFQRNFVWNPDRQSLLIESILMGLPLPPLYLSQYDDGSLTVVDGQQRLSAIRKFLRNELRLSGLEYLKECNHKTYEEVKQILSPLQMRQFLQAQIGCFVIDYRSPDTLKFDLFRRLNTGSEPLNRPEIRNCLTRKRVQVELAKMWGSDEFKVATGGSVKNMRMQATDLAVRFLYFSDQYTGNPEKPLRDYSGKIEESLDEFIPLLNKRKDFEADIARFKNAMIVARYLFGDYAFRKQSQTLGRRLAINQQLFVTISILVADMDLDRVKAVVEEGGLVEPLYSLTVDSPELKQALGSSTSSRKNMETAFRVIETSLFAPLSLR